MRDQSTRSSIFYTFLIMFAASLWAVDGIFRTNLTYSIPPASIVFLEHLIGTIILLPILIKVLPKIKSLNFKDWMSLLALTVVSSALGSILFTKAFSFGDFLTPILLQKLQPVFVIIFSVLFLKEKINAKQLLLSVTALIGSYMIHFGIQFPSFIFGTQEIVYFLSVGAALCWGFGTILSKNALNKLSSIETTSLRFLLAIPVTLFFALILNQTYNFGDLTSDQILRFLIIALIGVSSILIYYKGLKNVKASIATIAELVFPVVSILIAITPLNPNGAPQLPSVANTFGIVILLGSIFLLNFASKQK